MNNTTTYGSPSHQSDRDFPIEVKPETGCSTKHPRQDDINTNYNLDNFNSEDETDDEDEPRKPVPEWAQDQRVRQKAMAQSRRLVNFTRLFTQCTQDNIILGDIFSIEKPEFTQRSSSANWLSPPVWRTKGLIDQSFRRENS